MREAAARELPDQRPLFLTVYGEQTSENSKIDVDLHTISTYPGFWGRDVQGERVLNAKSVQRAFDLSSI